jgi:hypothetical protein
VTGRATIRRRRAVALIVLALLAFVAVALAGELLVVQTHGARVRALTFHSRFVHRDQRMLLVTPAGGGEGRPLLAAGSDAGARPRTALPAAQRSGVTALRRAAVRPA